MFTFLSFFFFLLRNCLIITIINNIITDAYDYFLSYALEYNRILHDNEIIKITFIFIIYDIHNLAFFFMQICYNIISNHIVVPLKKGFFSEV